MVAFFFIGAFCVIIAVIAMVVADDNSTNSNGSYKPNLFLLAISIVSLCLAIAFWTTAAIYNDYNEMRARLAYGNNVITYDLPAERINELGIDLKDPAIVYSKAYYVRDITSNSFFWTSNNRQIAL